MLREPVSQVVSAFNYFGYAERRSWKEQLEWLRSLPTHDGNEAARLQNGMASDLGWYEARKRATSFESFMVQLGNDLDYVLLLEKLDEGLVLLAHMLGLSLPEVAYASMKMAHAPHIQPTEPELSQLKSFIRPDVTVYSFFKEKGGWRCGRIKRCNTRSCSSRCLI